MNWGSSNLILFRKKMVPVYFNDYPGYPLDTSTFNFWRFNHIKDSGISISPVQIMHCACIHYASRFRNPTYSFLNSFLEIVSSLPDSDTGEYLVFVEGGDPELQGKSTEVIAVGLSIFLSIELFRIKRNRIYKIEGTTKRCDFEFYKNNLRYVIESKGRKRNTSSARDDVFQKKYRLSSTVPKYGFISHIPRDGKPTKIEVVDPEYQPQEVSRFHQIVSLLKHYSVVSNVCGFWRLTQVLNKRIKQIEEAGSLDKFDNVALDFENIIKFGYQIQAVNQHFSATTFLSGTQPENDYRINFLMEISLLEILEVQNFDALLEYEFKSEPSNEFIESRSFSALDDGSFLYIGKAK